MLIEELFDVCSLAPTEKNYVIVNKGLNFSHCILNYYL